MCPRLRMLHAGLCSNDVNCRVRRVSSSAHGGSHRDPARCGRRTSQQATAVAPTLQPIGRRRRPRRSFRRRRRCLRFQRRGCRKIRTGLRQLWLASGVGAWVCCGALIRCCYRKDLRHDAVRRHAAQDFMPPYPGFTFLVRLRICLDRGVPSFKCCRRVRLPWSGRSWTSVFGCGSSCQHQM